MSSLNFVTQLPHLVSAGIMVFLAGTVLLNTVSKSYTRPFAFLIMLVALDTVNIVLDNLTTVLWQKELFHTISSISIVMAVPFWLIFITLYSGHPHWLTRPVKWMIWSISGFMTLARLTNHWHQWVFIIETTPVFNREHGFLAYIYLVYTIGAMLYGIILFWIAISASKGVFRRQFIFIMLGATLLVLGESMVFIFKPDTFWSHMLRPVSWFFAAAAFLLGIYRSQFLDMIPLSHKTFFEQVQTGFVACDEAGRIRAVNPAAIQILDQPLKELIGQQCETAFAIFTQPPTDEMITSSHSFQHETQLLNGNKEAAVWYQIESSPLDVSGQQPGTSFILRDITQVKETEKLRHSLTRMVYHDLAQPISAILIALELVERAHMRQNDEKHHQYLYSAQEQSESLLNMVRNLRTINQIETNSLKLNTEACNLTTLVEQTLNQQEMMAHSQAITLSYQTADTSLTIVLDSALIQRVLSNLISNAMRFTPENGYITVKVESLKPNDNAVEISVIDTGTGLKTENPEELFYEGVSLGDRKSTGLGLAFCRMVVEAHDGHIEFKNVPSGACITFTLPITPSPASAHKPLVHTYPT